MNKIFLAFIMVVAILGCSMPGEIPGDPPPVTEEVIGFIPTVWFGSWDGPNARMANVAFNDPPDELEEADFTEYYAVQMSPIVTGWKEDKETKLGEERSTTFRGKQLKMKAEKVDDDRIKMRGDVEDGANFTIDFNHKDKTFTYTHKIIYDVNTAIGVVRIMSITTIDGYLNEDHTYSANGTSWILREDDAEGTKSIVLINYNVKNIDTKGNTIDNDFEINISSVFENNNVTTEGIDFTYSLEASDMESIFDYDNALAGENISLYHTMANGWF